MAPCCGADAVLLGKSSTNKVQQSNNKHPPTAANWMHGMQWAYLRALHIVCSATYSALGNVGLFINSMVVQAQYISIFGWSTLQMKIR